MAAPPGPPRRWTSIPAAGALLAALLLVAGLGVIGLSERNYRAQSVEQARVQAAILAESVVAAVDFGDAAAAQDSVNALRVNNQVRSAAVYDQHDRLFAGFSRNGRPIAQRRRPLNPDGSLIEVEAPVAHDGERIGSVRLSLNAEPLARRFARYALIGLFVIMAALVVAVLGVAHSILRRANRQLEERAEALADANRELTVQIAERAKAEEQLRQAQKMQALGQLTGGIAHDFNNLLTVIQGSADILRRPNIDDTKRVRFADAIVETAGRAAELTGQLLAFARRQPLRPRVIDLGAQVESMVDLLSRTLGERINVRTELGTGKCHVEVDPAQLEAAVLNIAVNARDAMPEGGTLTIRTGDAEPLDGERAFGLSLTDTGGGIDAEALGRVFEPFYTTKAVGKGTGLGLSQVYGFAKQSGGDVRIESEPGDGTTVTIVLPCALAQPDEPPSVAAAEPPPRHKTGRILLVDDNDNVGAFAETMLRELGHEVARARSGDEALELAGQERFDAVFTDVVMPEMSGLQLADRIHAILPDVPVILTTGYSDELSRSGSHGLPVVYKPYRLETIAAALDQVLAPGNGEPRPA